MGITKSTLFTEEQNYIASIAKTLGHPARIAILQHIFQAKSCICGDLVDEIGLAQPTISQHLRELKALHLIKGTIEGKRICYCIDVEHWSKIKHIMNTFLNLDFDSKCC